MSYVRYWALKDRTVQRLPKHCVCRSNNTFIFNQQTKYTTDCTLKIAAAATRAGGGTKAVKQARRVKTQLSLPNQTSAIITKGIQKNNKPIHQTK